MEKEEKKKQNKTKNKKISIQIDPTTIIVSQRAPSDNRSYYSREKV